MSRSPLCPTAQESSIWYSRPITPLLSRPNACRSSSLPEEREASHPLDPSITVDQTNGYIAADGVAYVIHIAYPSGDVNFHHFIIQAGHLASHILKQVDDTSTSSFHFLVQQNGRSNIGVRARRGVKSGRQKLHASERLAPITTNYSSPTNTYSLLVAHYYLHFFSLDHRGVGRMFIRVCACVLVLLLVCCSGDRPAGRLCRIAILPVAQ